MKTITLTLFLSLLFFTSCKNRNKITILSPDGNLKMIVYPASPGKNNGFPGFSVEAGNRKILLPSTIMLKTGKESTGSDFIISGTEKTSVTDSWKNDFGERKEVPDNYNQVKISLVGNNLKMNLICRAYNEGVAFAYEFPQQEGADSLTINDEKIVFHFQSDYYAWSALRAQAAYSHVPLSKIGKGCERPLVVEIDSNLIIALAEAELVDYARIKFEPDTSEGFGVRTRLGSIVTKKLPFWSPWRVIMTGKNPGDLLEKNYLILNLNDPCEISDVSWIRPGKALREVTLTTKGGLAAVDFAASHKMQYIEFDAGWYGPENSDASDARSVNVDPARSKGPLDLEKVISYGKSRDIGVLLYVNRKALERQLDDLLPIYSKWGVAGIKFGFVQVGSQDATRWLHESIKKLAEYKMVADVHDEYRPTGFSRTYPNFLTMEGIRGDEESPSNHHTLITMFTRMIAGQGDNTICYYNERVEKMGSHASQLAKAVCIFSPLQFLFWYDKAAPDNELSGTNGYTGNEPELEFFNAVPTVWDETQVLSAKIGEYGIIARRSGNEWFIGGINGENPVKLNIRFQFLATGTKFKASIYSDDPSVETRTHVRIENTQVDANTVYPVTLNSNTGIAFRISPADK